MGDRESLEKQLQRTRETLNILKEQKAGYGLNVPVHIELEIREKEEEVARIESKIASLDVKDDQKPVGELENERDSYWQKIQEIEQRIAELKQSDRRDAVRDLESRLHPFFESHAYPIQVAYCRALKERAIARFPRTVAELIQDLVGRCPPSELQPWLDRFVGYLLIFPQMRLPQMEVPTDLVTSVSDWAQTHLATSWENLQQEIDGELEISATQRPCFLVRVRRSNQQSISGQKGERYYVDAWFIEDERAYREQQIRAKPVRPASSWQAAVTSKVELGSPAQTYTEAETKTLICHLREQCYQVYHSERPRLHIFVPIELINIDIDRWSWQAERPRKRFGNWQEVVVRSGDRLGLKYELKQEWQEKWIAIERKFSHSANQVFRMGNLDADEIYSLGQEIEVLAIQLERAISELERESLRDLFEALVLDSAIPVALWLRQSVSNCPTELEKVLCACYLEKLPDKIKQVRGDPLALQEDDRLGNHLSLLWDDPKMIPPQSADVA